MIKQYANDIRVHRVKIPKILPQDIPGYDMFPTMYWQTAIVTRKNSGKTNLVYNILNHCIDRNSKVIIIASTAYKDPIYVRLIDKLHKRNIPVLIHTDVEDIDEDGRRCNVLEDFMNNVLEADIEEDNEVPEITKAPMILTNRALVQSHPKRPKKPKIPPMYYLICDDQGTANRHASMQKLMKKNRHCTVRLLISTQFITDIAPSSIRQLDYLIIMKGQPDKRLQEIHSKAAMSIDYADFVKLYNDATEAPYSFLYCDLHSCVFRENFNIQYQLH